MPNEPTPPPTLPTTADILGGNIDPAKLAAAAGSLHTIGVIFLVLGIMGFLFPVLASIAVAAGASFAMIFFGVLGLMSVFGSHGKHHPHRGLVILVSIVSIISGLILSVDVQHTVNALTLLLAIVLVVQGVVELTWAARPELAGRRGWLVLAGICSLLLAGIIFTHWPNNTDWILGFLISIRLIFLGATFMSLPTTPPPPAPAA
jgi:uncharacterized membrane protein HdeD (DUF308 family)